MDSFFQVLTAEEWFNFGQQAKLKKACPDHRVYLFVKSEITVQSDSKILDCVTEVAGERCEVWDTVS